MTDAELACIAVAQVLLRFGDERHWLRIAPKLIGHPFPRLVWIGTVLDRLNRHDLTDEEWERLRVFRRRW